MPIMMRPSDMPGGFTGRTSTALGAESTLSSCRMHGESDGLILSTVNTATTPLGCGEQRVVVQSEDDMRPLSDRTDCTIRGEYSLRGRDSQVLDTGSMDAGYERL
jgi:hypothetical protein